MANVRVAVRVRPLSKREIKEGGRIIVEVDGNVAKIRNLKVDSRPDGFGDFREKIVAFGFDYCYWSVNPEDPQYASQDVVFQDLGTEVLSGAAKGYNICLFAYGQTGSGKTYTMLGTPTSVGLTPRICEGLFIREEDYAPLPSSCRIKVSFLEIYNERVRDLLKQSDKKKSYSLRVREHPELGPYVQGLSQHVVTNYKQVIQLLEEGIANRITAATHIHEASSRSHAIFTIYYTQAVLENNLPSEIASKINLVDLAGSERADPSYCKDRITEGANINKSLVTLGIVISTLAQNSQAFSSCQSLNSAASDGDSGIPSSPSGTSSGAGPSRRQSYIPYRDSVLTWLLKDSLGGNSKTIMVATVSPAHTSYSETMSTLRYASNAKHIINKPRVNEDANVKLIRELREEIRRLKAMLLNFELRNFSPLNEEKDENLKELVLQNELKIDHLTKDWTQKWNEWKALVENYRVDINRRRAGVVIDSSLPHLMALEDDVLSTGVVLYHLKNMVSIELLLWTKKEGTTKIGRIDSEQEQDIVLQGQWIERDHCTITSACGVVILRPARGARCTVNGREVTASCRLTQGAVITLGKAQKFRFNHPAEAAVLRQRRQVGEAVGGSGSLEWLDLDGDVTTSRLGISPLLWKKRRVLEEQSDEDHQPLRAGEAPHRAQIQQQHYVGDLRQRILAGQIRAKQDLELDQAHISRQIKDNQQWLLGDEIWLTGLQQQDHVAEKELKACVPSGAWLQTDSETPLSPLVRSQKREVRLRLGCRNALRVAQRDIRRRKASFQLERIKKQRLLESQKGLEPSKATCWLQDDCTQKPPYWVPSTDAMLPGPQHRSRLPGCSSLSLRGLCSWYFPQLHSIFLNRDPSTMPDPTDQISEKIPSEEYFPQAAAYPPRTGHFSKNAHCSSGRGPLCTARGALARKGASVSGTCLTVSSESASIQEMERAGKQPCRMVSQSLASLDHSVNKLKPRDNKPVALTPSTYIRWGRGLADSDHTRAEWQKEENLGTHKTAKGACCSSSQPCGPKQASGHGKAAEIFWVESKPPSQSRASKRQQRVLVKDIVKKSSCLPHGSPLRRQYHVGDPDSTSSLTDSSPRVDHIRDRNGDLSDTNSRYSVDSLSCVYAKALMEPLKPEDPQRKEQGLPEPENSESDDSEISEDSLAEKGYESPPDNPGSSYLPSGHGHPRTRVMASVRGFTTSSNSGLFTQTHRSFSLDSLIDAKEELREEQQEEGFFSSADEMPTETFWHLQTSSLPIVEQEAMCRLGPISNGMVARLDAILPMSSSFYLGTPPQPPCEQPESEVEASSSEQTNMLQGLQLSRGSPLLSMDSWFSCDSKINSSSPSGIVGSLCPSPDVQESQPHGWERPGHGQNIEELKPSGAEILLPYTSKLPQGGTELPCCVRGVYTIPASDTSKLSFWGSYRLLQPRVAGIFQARGIPDTAQEGNSEASNNSSVSSVLAASAASFTHVGSTHERDWGALQQKYLLELSHPVLEAIRESRPTFSSLEEDSASLTQGSGKETDTLLPVGSGVSSSLDFSNFPVHLSKIQCLRAEKEQDSLSAELEGTSDFFTIREKEVSHSGTYSADVESLTSGTTNVVPVFAAESKMANSTREVCQVKQNNLEESSQSSGKPQKMSSSDECFFLKSPCHSNITIVSKENHWPQGWAPPMKNSAAQEGQLSHPGYPPLQEEKVDYQESSREVVRRHPSVSFAFLSGPKMYPHSGAWNPLPSSLQPPPLETFYVTKSRDALTETALEIPACRESRVPSPSPREAWGFGHDHQVLQNIYFKNNFPVLLQNQNSKTASSQQVTAGRPVDLNTKEVSRERGKCPGNIEEESHNSVYFFVAQNKHFLSSTSTKVCEFENQVGILNNHNLSALKEREKATVQSCCNVCSSHSRSRKPLLVCESEADGEEEQDHNVVLRQTQALDMNRQFPSGARSDFIYETINLALDNDMLGEAAISLQSRSVHHRVSGPKIMAPDESPAHKGERKNESGLLGKAFHPKDSSKEFKHPKTESIYERFQSVTCSQEKNLNESKGPGRSEEMLSPKEPPSGKKQNKRVNSGDEMARLIRSVMQLEDGILEIESKQNKQLSASQTLGVGKEFLFWDQRDQEMADYVLRPSSFGNYVSLKDQPSSPKQTDDVTFRDSEAREMEVDSSTGEGLQAQKITLSPFRSRECIQDTKFAKEDTCPAVLNRSSRDTCDYVRTCTVCREFTDTCANPRTKALASALPLQPSPKMSSEKESEAENASASPPTRQPCGLGSLEELETVKDFWETQVAKCISSSKQEEPKVQGRVEEMAVRRGGSLQEENTVVSLIQQLPSPSQRCIGTSSSQEIGPLLSQPDFSEAPHGNLHSSLPLNSPRLPRDCLHAHDTVGISSVDYVLDPTILKIPNSPLVTGAESQDLCGEPQSHSPQGTIREGSSSAHSAWCGSVISTSMRSHGQFCVSENIPLGAEGKRSVSTQDQGGDLRSILMGLSSRDGFASEAEAAVQRGTERATSLNRASSPLEKKASCLLEEGNSQGCPAEEAEDLYLPSGTFSAPVSLPRMPLPERCAHTSMGLGVLEEITQAQAQGKQLHDLGAGGNILPYYETLLGPECSSGVTDQSLSDRTRNEAEAQRFHVASLSAEPGHLLTNERKVSQATPLPADSFQHLPSTETHIVPQPTSQISSHVAPTLGKSYCSGELRLFLGAGEQLVCHSSSSGIIEKKKKATTTPSSADPESSGNFPSVAVEDRREIPEKVVAALPSWTPLNDPGMIPHRGSHSALQATIEATLPGGQESSPAHQEPRILDTTYGGSSGNVLVAAKGGKTTCFESQLVTCDVQNSVSLSGCIQDYAPCLEAFTGLEEGRASPKQGTNLPRALRRVELEAPSQQCVKRKESVGCGLAEACHGGSKHSRLTSLPDQRPSPSPGGVQEEAQCRCPREASYCVVFLGNIEHSRTLSLSRGQEDNRTTPCHLCNPKPIASLISFSPLSTLPGYRDGDLGKESSKAALHTLQPPCVMPSRISGMDERGESCSRELEGLLAPGLEPKVIHREFGPTDSSTQEPSASAAVLSLVQGVSSPSAPGMRTSSLSHSVADGSSRSVEDPEKEVAEKKPSTELETAFSSADVCSEPLRKFQGSSVGGQNTQESQTKPELPLTVERPHTLNLSEGSVESELPGEPQHGCLGNVIQHLPEKPQLSTEFRDHSGLGPQAKFVAKLKHISRHQADGPWEEEGQQRDQALSGSKEPARDRSSQPSHEGGLDGCQIRDAGTEEASTAKSFVSKMFLTGFEDSAAMPLGQSGAPRLTPQSPGLPASGREQPAPHHRCSLPVIAVFSGPKHSRSSPRPQFSVVSSSRSLQELNLSVEPPSPTDEDIQESNRLWSPHHRDYFSDESAVRTSLKAEGCSQKASSNVDNRTDNHWPPKPTTPPYPRSSALSCMPTPDFMASWTPRTLEESWQENLERPGSQARPEKWHSEADKKMLHFDSSDINPYILSSHPERPVQIGWKQYVFGSALDVSCGQTPQGLIPSNKTRCSSMDKGLEHQNSPLYSHLSTHANARDLSSTHSSIIGNAQGSCEAWEVWGSSFALGNLHILNSPEGATPSKGADKRAQFWDTPDEVGCLRNDPLLAEGSAASPVDEIMLLYPSEVGGPVGQSRINTLEQGTQTLGCSLHWSSTDISAQPETRAVPVSGLVSWTSMHNLSLHLSQLLHSTSELLGSLSQPSVAEKEQNIKRETPDEVTQALMIDGYTQTTMDKGIQTDLAFPPLHLQAPEAGPQEVSGVLEVLGSDIPIMFPQERGHVTHNLQKRETEEMTYKMARPSELQEESTHCRPQSLPASTSHVRFQKAHFGQNLPSVSPQAFLDASLPPSSQPEVPSCLAVGNPSLSSSQSPEPCLSAAESVRDPQVKKGLGTIGTLLVDRASSPILTLSASTQRLGFPSDSLSLTVPSACPPEGHQKLVSSPDLLLDTSRLPVVNNPQTTDESGGSQRVGALCGEGRSPLERSDGRPFLKISSPDGLPQSPKLQVCLLEQPPQQLQPRTTTLIQSGLPPPSLRSQSQRLANGLVPDDLASLECDPVSSRGPSRWQSKTEHGDESSASPVEPQPTLDFLSSREDLQPLIPCPVSGLTEGSVHRALSTGLQGSALGPTEACQTEMLLCSGSQVCVAPEPQHHSLRDFPVHNRYTHWCGVQDGSPVGLGLMESLGPRCDLSSGEQGQKPLQPPDDQSQGPHWSQREQIPLQVGAQNLSLSMELTEAKLHHGFGEADALLQVLQSGTGEALSAEEPVRSTWEELYARQKQTIETLRRERAERLQNLHWMQIRPRKQLSLLPNRDLPTRDLDLPSRRREYLQQLRKDVVETTRSLGSASRSAHPASDIAVMLQEYQRAREEAKVEIALARDRLRERTDQEKLRIRQQIISQLLKEEEKLHTLAMSNSLSTSSNGSLSSGVTSGYNSSTALPDQIQSPDSVGDINLLDCSDSWIGDVRGSSTVRTSHLSLAGSAWKSLASGPRTSLGSGCCSPSSLSSLGACFSSSYQDLAKHIVDLSIADVMAACSDNLHNLFSCQAAAGWNYQGEEQEVRLYYKMFSSTRHGFLGAGVVSQPLSHVWAAVSDPTLWPLYHKPIQTARLHQRVTNSINLVYLVCDTTLCALKQPRDFCCVCVEAKEVPVLLMGHLSIMAAQSVYDTSMPRPSRKMVRGEILPSAWILQPVTVEGKEITRVIYLAQVELGAPGFPPQLLSSFIKQQPLVIARLASFLGC